MTPQERAEIWRRAAQVIDGMDYVSAYHANITQHMIANNLNTFSYSDPFSKEDASASRAFGRAATVLRTIADEYERAAAKEPA